MTSAIQIIEPLSLQEAQAWNADLKVATADYVNAGTRLQTKLHEFKLRRGWETLKYDSFKAYCQAELGHSWQHAYKLVEAEEIIRGSESLPDNLPVSHAKALGALTSPERRGVAYHRAVQLAATEGDGTPVQTRHIEAVVQEEITRDRVHGHPLRNAVIVQMMNKGEVTPAVALKMHDNLKPMQPRVRGYISQVMARYGLTCAELMPPIAVMFAQKEMGQKSRVLDELLANGRLAGVTLKKATISDLNRANSIAADEALEEERERLRKLRGWVEVIETIRKGDPEYTANVLAQTLSPFDLLAVIGELQAIAAKGFEG